MPISEVFNQDNMIVMQNFTDNFFDLAIVDPPYGINAPGMKMGENINRKDGTNLKFTTNAGIIIKDNIPLCTRLNSIIPNELRRYGYTKLISLAPIIL